MPSEKAERLYKAAIREDWENSVGEQSFEERDRLYQYIEQLEDRSKEFVSLSVTEYPDSGEFLCALRRDGKLFEWQGKWEEI